jgi:hypothetical protein
MLQVSALPVNSNVTGLEEEITGFADADPIYLNYSSRPSEETILADLPEYLDVYLSDSEVTSSIPVSWECVEDYESTEDYYYQYNPVWDKSNYTIADSKEIPYAGIFLYSASTSIKTFSTSSVSNETTVYKYLTEKMGLNTAAACGVLANIQKESNFNPTSLGDKGTSYGICQWHNGRWTAMKNYCSKNGYSSSSLEGQLHYLQYELENVEPYKTNVLPYIKAVTNNAQGAYNAAYRWCLKYEIPADTEETSEVRGNLAKNTYWPKYADQAVSKADTIKVSGATQPGDLKEGTPFAIRGKISATSKMTSVTAGVYDSNGTLKSGKTVSPNATSYNLLQLDSIIKFGSLPAGSYTYKVVAKTSSKKVTLINKSFRVLGIIISNESKPDNVVVGSIFNVKGTIASNYGKLTSVVAGVYDTSGKKVIGATAKPNKSSYNLSKINNSITFGKLSTGTYTYKVVAKTSNTTKTLVSQKFKVTPKQGKLSSLKVFSKRKLKVAWREDITVTGYQIQYATKKSFKNAKKVTVKNYKTITKTLTSLTKGKKYYVRVREYKTIKDKKYYGVWSSYKLSGIIK